MRPAFGDWRSLVAHFVRDEGVGGSNPLSPTKFEKPAQRAGFFASVHGGMGMGIGWALYEELLVDPATGRVHNNNLLDYKFPTTCDIPDLDCAFVETQEPSGVYGNKSLGEPPLISPAPALRNAVLDATGVAVNAIPMTPKLLFEEFVKAGLIKG